MPPKQDGTGAKRSASERIANDTDANGATLREGTDEANNAAQPTTGGSAVTAAPTSQSGPAAGGAAVNAALTSQGETAEPPAAVNAAPTSQGGPAAGGAAASEQSSPNKYVAMAKTNASKISSPAKKATLAITTRDEGVVIVIHLVNGKIVSAALQGASTYALRPFALNGPSEVEPAKTKYYVNGDEKEVKHFFFNTIGLATIKGNPHLFNQHSQGNMWDMTDEHQRSILRTSRLYDNSGWSWAIYPMSQHGTADQRHQTLREGLKKFIAFIQAGTFPDTFAHARKLLRFTVTEDPMDVYEDHEALIRELPAMAEAMRHLRQERNSPAKASVL